MKVYALIVVDYLREVGHVFIVLRAPVQKKKK